MSNRETETHQSYVLVNGLLYCLYMCPSCPKELQSSVQDILFNLRKDTTYMQYMSNVIVFLKV